LSVEIVCVNMAASSRRGAFVPTLRARFSRKPFMTRKVRVSFVAFASALSLAGTTGCGDYPVASLKSGIGGSATGGGSGGGGGGVTLPPNSAPLPCEVLGNAGHECVSAHSTVRVIVKGYTSPLYQVNNGTGTLDIGNVDGYADAAAQDQFCSSGGCTISIIYDQSGRGNHLTPAPPGSAKATPGNPAKANTLPTQINGRSTYGILFRPGQGYRAACIGCLYPEVYPSGVPVGDEPETMYMLSSQHDLIDGCCFDYGNAEVTCNNDGAGTMETAYVGNGVIWGSGTGEGPWAMADMENGIYAGWDSASASDTNIATNTPLRYDFINAVVVGDTADKNGGKGRFALYGGDATSPMIKEMYDGIRPEKQGYVPMAKQGSVILGIGGDNSNTGGGRFYEGAIALKAATAEVVSELHAAIAEAGYGK
jgi:non-reducing end alpha-L-arabinofuranosidase